MSRSLNILFFLFFMVFGQVGQSQTVLKAKSLLAENRNTGTQYEIDYSSTVKITLKNDAGVFKGVFTPVSNFTFSIAGLEFPLDDIESITTSNKGSIVGGGVVIGVGVVGLTIGALSKIQANNIQNPSLESLFLNTVAFTFLTLGTIVTVVGVIIASVKRKYTSKQYKFIITST